MNNYTNPMITYTEIVEALKAILDSSKSNGYLDDYNFLNVGYDMLNKSPLYKEQEQALIQAIQSLEKTIDAADKVIRENLKTVLDEIAASNLFMIPTRYKKNEEYRKLAAQSEFVMKLREMSLPLEVLSDAPAKESVSEKIDEIEELVNPPEEVKVEEIPSLEEEEKIDYYSRVKLGNVKNAFAVTEEQYEKLRQYVPNSISNEEIEEVMEIPSLVSEESSSIEDIEAVAEVEQIIPEEEETKIPDDITINDVPVESPKEEKEELSTEEPKIEETIEIDKEEPVSEEEAKEEIEETTKEDTPVEEKTSKEKEEQKPELTDEKKALMNRIQLIKKALDKAKEKENTQLVQILEQQLRKEIEIFKS